MSKRYLFFILLIVAALSCQPSNEESQILVCDKGDIVSPKLLSIKEAHDLLVENTSGFLPVEVSKVDEYSKGHIKGAVHIWRPDFRSKSFTTYGGMMCNEQELNAFLQNLGIREGDSLLLYDNKGGSEAMRLSWVLDFYGFGSYKLINGGKTAWVQSGYPVETIVNNPSPNRQYKFAAQADSSLLAQMNDVLIALEDTNTIVIDTREPNEYLGKPFLSNNEVLDYKDGAFERGCIPGSIHLNWSDLSDLSSDHRIKCSRDLIYNLEQKGITKDKDIIVYCQSGSRSSHTAFVLREILDYPSVRNYDGSWIEWSYYYKNGKSVPILQITDESTFEVLRNELSETVKELNG